MKLVRRPTRTAGQHALTDDALSFHDGLVAVIEFVVFVGHAASKKRPGIGARPSGEER